jgi:outer membrane lipoprotein-sorting protein
MRRFKWVVTLVMCLSLVLAGCGFGKKDAAGVVKDLNGVMDKLQSYHGTGTMTLHTGQEPQEYAVEVCYEAPHFYRISLTNEKKDITQIVLRNNDGVFVLTPHLNKSFRFQSDWPENQGQVYLFQSLAQSILMDQERQMTTDEKSFVFDVVANYQNGSLARQKVWLDKKTYAPQHVEVADANGNVMVIVKFNEFEFGTKFDKDQFDMQRNMTSMSIQSLPTMAPAGDAAKTDAHAHATKDAGKNSSAATGTDAKATNGTAAVKQQDFGIIEPNYMPTGVKLQDKTMIKLGEDQGVMLRYSGKFNYTLVESRPTTQTVTSLPGDVWDLGFTLGVVTGDAKKTLTWTYDGVEFRLSSGDLQPADMIKIAQAVQGEMGK